MIFLALVLVLLLEHFRPLDVRNPAALLFIRYANHLERHFNAGEHAHGKVAWLLGALLPAMAIGGVYGMLYRFSPILALPVGVAVLYAVLGLKRIGAQAERIAAALRLADLDSARQQLTQWQGRPADDFEAAEIARVGIEQTLASSHSNLFGVIAWFVVLGPVGAVLYRLSQLLSHKWGALDEQEAGQFGQFAIRIFELMDWIPLRLTAVSFAIVGDFEDAIYCWRAQALTWMQQGIGIVLASGAGALGVKLGEPLHYGTNFESRPELGLGDEADADYLDSAVSLVWRAVLLWLVLLLLVTIAGWVGG